MNDVQEAPVALDTPVAPLPNGLDLAKLRPAGRPVAPRAPGHLAQFGATGLTTAILLVALVGLALLFVALRPSATPAAVDTRAPARALGASRVMMLLPDGRVEFADAWSRRVFRWDGRRWVELERQEPAPARAGGG